MKRMKNPSHPGDMIRVSILKPLELSITKAADVLGVRRATLSDLVNKKAALTPEMAMRIEKAFGPRAEHLMSIQYNYDLAQLRMKAKDIKVKRYRPSADGPAAFA